MRPATVVAMLLALTGCASLPEEDDGERPIAGGVEVAQSVVPCQTRVSDLESRLGPPSRDGRLGRSRIVTWIVAWEPLVKYLGVMADSSGTVVDVYWDLPSELPWVPVDRCTPAKAD